MQSHKCGELHALPLAHPTCSLCLASALIIRVICWVGNLSDAAANFQPLTIPSRRPAGKQFLNMAPAFIFLRSLCDPPFAATSLTPPSPLIFVLRPA
jgi:hypothetical protein